MGENLGMIGLGKMGLGLAQQMLADGHAVCGYDIDPVRTQMLVDVGGMPLPNAREVAENSDITFSILLKPEHIEENLFGPDGIDQVSKTGLIHVEMSTMPPAYSKDLASKLAASGIDMLDAPISGSTPQVDARTITFMVGGSDAAFARVQPIIALISADATHTGPSGSGGVMKVVTNMYVNASTALIAEMLLTGERAGLSPDVMRHCLPKGSVRGAMLDMSLDPVFNRDFTARGAVEIFVKDMGIAIDLAKENGIELQVVPAARAMFQRAEAAGWGKDDAIRVLEVYEGKD
ncbi:MAG: NAD(P)-dependent oxidoreductase [Alphaproteobacteria bacterium]|nr:NAD(P)-dependent oxidoreductase [Alphaproteobacteria bacterium]